MTCFARIAVNVPGVKDFFDYSIPENLEEKLAEGWLVEVPFGSQMVQGIILETKKDSEVPEVRPITKILENSTVLTHAQIQLAFQLSEQYLTPVSRYLFSMLPPGLGQRADTLFHLNAVQEIPAEKLSPLQKRIIKLMRQKGDLRGRQLDAAFRKVDWRPSARGLVRQGILAAQPVLPKPAVKAKHVRSVRITDASLQMDDILPKLGREGSQAYQRRLAAVQILMKEKEDMDVSWVYASSGANAADLRYLEKQGLIHFSLQEVWRDPLAGRLQGGGKIPRLTPDQDKAWERIRLLVEQGQFNLPVLVHGVTGSGKTELYMRAIDHVLHAGKQAIVIVPEISMTPQTIQRFTERFPDKVGVVHSKLSPGERYDTWRRARTGDFSIVIGPRSALFTPFPRIGVIVIDECHDDSLYQTDMGPYYHAVEAAVAFGRLNKSLVILGTATPTVKLYFKAQHEKWPLIELPQRILAHRQYLNENGHAVEGQEADSVLSLPLPQVSVVDMREELKQDNLSIFSRQLQQDLKKVLNAGQQAILLLNRRGSSTYVFCRDCGHTIRCPRCDLPLTYHRSASGLVCHTCGYRRKLPEKCPQCSSRRIKQLGTGTEKVEAELKKFFPGAGILRWDADTSRGKGSEEIILSHFRKHNADILIGTQMLAKGLDLPLVTLVGVVLADIGLNFPDYRTAERAFQLFTQVAGRAGRSALGGKVIIQTFMPEHYAIQRASEHDFKGFYKMELEKRRELSYPPFTHMIRFETRDRDSARAREKAQGLAGRLRAAMRRAGDKSLSLQGPLPPYFARQRGLYRWQIILKGSQPEKILKGEDLGDFIVEVDPPSLL